MPCGVGHLFFLLIFNPASLLGVGGGFCVLIINSGSSIDFYRMWLEYLSNISAQLNMKGAYIKLHKTLVCLHVCINSLVKNNGKLIGMLPTAVKNCG